MPMRFPNSTTFGAKKVDREPKNEQRLRKPMIGPIGSKRLAGTLGSQYFIAMSTYLKLK